MKSNINHAIVNEKKLECKGKFKKQKPHIETEKHKQNPNQPKIKPPTNYIKPTPPQDTMLKGKY